jgi:hypothetical protein
MNYDNLENGPIDEIDAAMFSGDIFNDRDNIDSFRLMLERWERQLKKWEELVSGDNE